MKAICILPLLLISFISGIAQTSSSDISTDEFEKAIRQKDIQLLDVRTMGEYQSGHITGAFQANWNDQKEFKERILALDKNKPVYVYCLAGPRSTAATAWLNQNGFKAYNMIGGMNAWKRAGKAVEQQESVSQITPGTFTEMLPAQGIALVDIGAAWCPPCKKMQPVVDSLEASAKGKYTVIRIDGGAQTDLATYLKADTFPTFIIYKDRKEIWRGQGVMTAATLSKQLK
ncbi:MAG: rhodanese-like domain-containing protein [Chitinophagaceae bacterium]